MQPKQLPPLKKSLITIGVLAIASLFSFLVVDESLMTNARLESLLPGDLLDVINHIGAFGHGAGCLVAVLLILNFDANGRRGISWCSVLSS